MKVKLTTCESGDWEILEVNGNKWASNHRISNSDWLAFISTFSGVEVDKEEITDEEMELRA